VAGRMEGRVTLITGGGSGIGRAAAVRFAREGAPVALLGRRAGPLREVAALVEAEGAPALVTPADVTREDDVRAAVAAVLERFGRLDVLVASAGSEGTLGQHLTEVSVEDWDRIMAVNVRGVFLSAKHAIPPMQRQGGGAIVVVASDSSFVATPRQVAYCTSKGAVLQFTRSLAVDLWGEHIRVNCVCPSAVDTPMLRRAVGDDLDQPGLEGIATADQVAAQILFLASDDAASMHGAALVADWGGMARSNWLV